MKKRSEKEWKHQRWQSEYVMRLRRKASPKRSRNGHRPKRSRPFEKALVAPSHFVLLSNSGHQDGTDVINFFDFLSKLRNATPPVLLIDMSQVRRMVADAALLFKAELSTLVQMKGITLSAIAPRSERTQQVLKQTGINQLLNLQLEGPTNREDVVHWRIAEGSRAYVDPNALEAIMADIEAVTGMASHPVYQGIIESMGNCVEHAYKSHPEVRRAMPESPGWWVFQQVKDDTLVVVVCDLGIGVSRALPLKLENEQGLLRKLMHLARRTKGDDNRALLAAMEYGRSSTGQPHRGKGMRNAHAVVNDIGEGSFYALSNKGCYMYKKDPTETVGNHRTFKLRHSINGTILGWRLPLRRAPIGGML